MNNFERVRDLVDAFVEIHGTNTEMNRGEFLEWVHETYENISAAKNNLYPTDISYNLFNAGLVDFPGPNLCLVYVEERNTFRLVGTNYKYTGPIWQYKNKSNERIVGNWVNGVCKMGETEIGTSLSEEVLSRREYVASEIKTELKAVPVSIKEEDNCILIDFQGILVCGISVEEENYKIYGASSEWAEATTYLCDEDADDTWFYYVETAEEVIGESVRLFLFEAKKGHRKETNAMNKAGNFRQIVTEDMFETAYRKFMAQAEENARTKKSRGPRIPEGFEFTNGRINGGNFTQHYGQGAASKTPYINWHVVSIYYVVDRARIFIGIEVDRYPHINKMKPLRREAFGNRKTDIAIFYETTKDKIDFNELYNKFISVSEEVMSIGLG